MFLHSLWVSVSFTEDRKQSSIVEKAKAACEDPCLHIKEKGCNYETKKKQHGNYGKICRKNTKASSVSINIFTLTMHQMTTSSPHYTGHPIYT